jgi:hypothetical protein
MHAKAPLDIDLEDKLLYGMTPIRLAYLAMALLASLALWSSPWAPSPVRMVTCFVVVAIGAALAWGRWRGRPTDAWVVDVSTYVISNHRLVRNWHRLERPVLQSIPTHMERATVGPKRVVVAAQSPQAGASTIAVELQAWLATKSDGVDRWTVSTAPAGQAPTPSPGLLSVTVTAADTGRVCYLDRGDGPIVAGLIPEDAAVRAAAALRLATVHAFPNAPASRAFRDLADLIAAGAP